VTRRRQATVQASSQSNADRLDETYQRYARSRRRQRRWAADNPGNLVIRNELVDNIWTSASEQLRDGEVLDIGCGTGWLLALLADSGIETGRLHGVDLLERRVARTRSTLPDVDVRRADALRLPFCDGTFDVVFLINLLSSLPDRPSVHKALVEARRVVSPRGILLIYESRFPNPLNPATRLVKKQDLNAALGHDWGESRLTVFPAFARRLGRLTALLYPLAAKVRPVLTHRLVVWRKRA
jgi:ubiquinone/menaquinone biosynthesis C-methylase UbiE